MKNPGLPKPEPITEYGQRQRFFEALARAILYPKYATLLLVDDLQWCDHETIEWLHFLLRFDPQLPLLVLATMRSEEMHPALTSEGNPLFVIEMIQAGFQDRIIKDELDPTEEFHLTVLPPRVQAVDELWQKRIISERAANTYEFTHEKLREVTYAEVSAPQRRLLHRRVAQSLEGH